MIKCIYILIGLLSSFSYAQILTDLQKMNLKGKVKKVYETRYDNWAKHSERNYYIFDKKGNLIQYGEWKVGNETDKRELLTEYVYNSLDTSRYKVVKKYNSNKKLIDSSIYFLKGQFKGELSDKHLYFYKEKYIKELSLFLRLTRWILDMSNIMQESQYLRNILSIHLLNTKSIPTIKMRK